MFRLQCHYDIITMHYAIMSRLDHFITKLFKFNSLIAPRDELLAGMFNFFLKKKKIASSVYKRSTYVGRGDQLGKSPMECQGQEVNSLPPFGFA